MQQTAPGNKVCKDHSGETFTASDGTVSKACGACKHVKAKNQFGKDGKNKTCIPCVAQRQKKPDVSQFKKHDDMVKYLMQRGHFDLIKDKREMKSVFNRWVEYRKTWFRKQLKKLEAKVEELKVIINFYDECKFDMTEGGDKSN